MSILSCLPACLPARFDSLLELCKEILCEFFIHHPDRPVGTDYQNEFHGGSIHVAGLGCSRP